MRWSSFIDTRLQPGASECLNARTAEAVFTVAKETAKAVEEGFYGEYHRAKARC